MRYKILLILAAIIFNGNVFAFSINDCLINGLKGVSSDLAVRQIRFACQQKYEEFKRRRLRELSKDFGDIIEATTIEQAGYWILEEAGVHSIEITNKNSDKTITYMRLFVIPAQKDMPCDDSKKKVYAYKITIKPQGKIKLIYPSSDVSECIIPDIIMARSKNWKDISLLSSSKPIENDPFEDLQ